MMTLPARFAALALLAACAGLASANDGFYAGAGSTLYPVEEKSLRVVRETLELRALPARRCYTTVVRTPAGGGKEFAELAAPRACEPHDSPSRGVVEWSAEAVYQVEALADRKGVRMGFPVPMGSREWADDKGDLDYQSMTGVAGFRTTLDGTPITGLKPHWLGPTAPKVQGGDEQLGYAWTADFTKGRHELRTEYDFGVDYMAGFYYSSDYADGERPWFASHGEKDCDSKRVEYFLTPLRLWAPPPPERVSIAVTLPEGVPTVWASSLGLKPSCVGERSLFYEFRGAVPPADLKLAYPTCREGRKLPSLRTVEHWKAWLAVSAGKGVRLNCALLESLKAGADGELKAVLAKVGCVKTCRTQAAAAPAPFPAPTESRRALTREYCKAHYGLDSEVLVTPKLIVIHHTVLPTLKATLETFRPERLPESRTDLQGHGAVNVGAHFVVDRDGKVQPLLPEDMVARHAIGFNHVALGIENVAKDADALTEAQLDADAALVEELLRRHPTVEYLIGHHEYADKTLPHHALFKELDAGYELTVKSDPGAAFMRRLREKLAARGVVLKD